MFFLDYRTYHLWPYLGMQGVILGLESVRFNIFAVFRGWGKRIIHMPASSTFASRVFVCLNSFIWVELRSRLERGESGNFPYLASSVRFPWDSDWGKSW